MRTAAAVNRHADALVSHILRERECSRCANCKFAVSVKLGTCEINSRSCNKRRERTTTFLSFGTNFARRTRCLIPIRSIIITWIAVVTTKSLRWLDEDTQHYQHQQHWRHYLHLLHTYKRTMYTRTELIDITRSSATAEWPREHATLVEYLSTTS